MAQTTRTIDHEEIRDWVESRGGRPAVVEGTHDIAGSGILRIDMGEGEESLEEVSWQEFFRIFDENDLAFVYQEVDEEGNESYFCKFVARNENEEDDGTDEIDFGDDVSDTI